MRVSLIKDKRIQNVILPTKIEGSYWITDTDSNGISKNLISIEADNNTWKIISNNEVFFVEDQIIKPYAILLPNHFYTLKNSVENEFLSIYCSEVEEQYNCYDITKFLETCVLVGSNPNATISFSAIGPEDIAIKRENNKIYLYDNQAHYGIYVNDVRLFHKKELKYGDVIFSMGLKMIFLSHANSREQPLYLCINNRKRSDIKTELLAVPLTDFDPGEYKEALEEIEFPLYEEKAYFHKMPRFIGTIKTLELQVDAPPTKTEEANNSMLLTIGPMITMSMMSLVMGYNAVSGLMDGTSTLKRAMPSLIICGAMFASVFIWPLISKQYEKRNRIKNEKLRQKKYGAYIEEKRKAIIDAKKQQAEILKNNFPTTTYCLEVINRKYTTLWQRRIEDDDYLEVNLGTGNSLMKIDIKYPEDHFSMAEDNLKDMVSALGREPKTLSDVPIPFSFFKNPITGIIGEQLLISEYFKQLLIQILAFHSYDDLKIVVLTEEEKEYQWQFLKDCPHCFSNDRSLRFFATNNNEYKEVCYYLDRLFHTQDEQPTSFEKEPVDQVYLIITDCFKKVRDFDVLDRILEKKEASGISLVILDSKITNLPDQCQTFIEVLNGIAELHNNINYKEAIKFTLDLIEEIDYEHCAKVLANIPIELDNKEEGQLPNRLGFLELYDVGKVEQFNSLQRWQSNNPILNLQVPVGVGKNGEKISIDLHEKYHGPHGLIAGMTGSGKSEFLITYILSMAINYHPYEVQFILIDYKGGGLAGAFENKLTGLKLPHLVGTITNLDANEIKRSLASIESELKRRQSLFNKAREATGESTIDIYKYQKMYREGLVEEPVSHLFIISDEFAELKNQQPEFMEQLISTARIGRSLGVHLILATQKPSGVVDPQIWSNTRFRVCLRVQEKSDSNEVIKSPDAAFLKQTGRFYFQVGYNEVFVLGQSAWAGGKYLPSEKVVKNLDTSLNFIDNIGYPIKNLDTKPKQEIVASKGEELTNIVRYLSDTAVSENLATYPLWLERIPELIKIEDLAIKYHYQKEDFLINPILGEYDIPDKQQQSLLTLPFSKEGNAIVYGSVGSGKENFITTLLYASMLSYSSKEVHYYLIDFGSGSLKMFQDCPLVGDIVTSEEEEKLENLYKMLTTVIEKRKELFSEYGGDYQSYYKNSGKRVPNLIVIINNYESYQETYGKYDDTLVILSREGIKYGIYFVISANTASGIRFKLKQNFSLFYVLQQNNEDDYTTILGNVHKTYPTKCYGRGIFKTDQVYEFQTALVTEREEIPTLIKQKCLELQATNLDKAKSIPILPEIVTYREIASEFGKGEEWIIGIEKDSLEVYKYPFQRNYITFITSLELSITSKLINSLINQAIALKKTSLIVINAEDYLIEPKYTQFYEYVDQNFDDLFSRLLTAAHIQKDRYKTENFDRKVLENEKEVTCFIIGIDSFKAKLKDENRAKFGELFETAKDLGTFDFIIVDSIDKIRKIEMESWYKNCVNPNYGIWVGNGINDQFTLKINQKIEEMREQVPDNFCFAIQRGKPVFVKYLEKLDLKVD